MIIISCYDQPKFGYNDLGAVASWQSSCEGDDETVVEIMAFSYRVKSIFVNES